MKSGNKDRKPLVSSHNSKASHPSTYPAEHSACLLCNYSDTRSIIFPYKPHFKGPLCCKENENKPSQPGSDLAQYPHLLSYMKISESTPSGNKWYKLA